MAQRGFSIDAAEREAFARFGAPDTVAAQFAWERYGMLNQLLIVLARLAGLIRANEPRTGEGEYHVRDVPAFPRRYHFGARLKWRARNRFKKMSPDERKQFIARMKERGEDVSAFEADPREHLVQFLRKFGPRTLDPNGTLESLTLLEDTTDSKKRGGRYLAAFGSGAQMIWTVVQAADGTIFLDGTSAP